MRKPHFTPRDITTLLDILSKNIVSQSDKQRTTKVLCYYRHYQEQDPWVSRCNLFTASEPPVLDLFFAKKGIDIKWQHKEGRTIGHYVYSFFYFVLLVES